MKKKAKIWIASATVFVIATGALGYKMLGSEWVDVGGMVTYVESQGAEEITKIPYRFYDYKHKQGVVPYNVDMADLELATNSRKAIGKQVMIGVYACSSPQVRSGWPTVFCSVTSGGSIYVSGDEKIRSQLMHLSTHQRGSLIGILIDQYGGSPFIKVL